MLSRLSLTQNLAKDFGKLCIRPISTSQATQQYKEGPERDLVNFPRPKRAMYSGKVRLGFLPEEWFTFFYNKTGVTGPYTLGFTLTTYLVSKEIYVLEHEYYTGISIIIMLYFATTRLGPKIAAVLDKHVDKHCEELDGGRKDTLDHLQNSIAAEEKFLWQAEGQKLLLEAKRENVLLQLEAAYRERLMTAYTMVKKRLTIKWRRKTLKEESRRKTLWAGLFKMF